MDILRKELNGIYSSQHLERETLPHEERERSLAIARSMVEVSEGCTVITDASCDRCWLYSGAMGMLFGIADSCRSAAVIDSSDEDVIYGLIHPEDLVDKRMLEYEFFRMVDLFPAERKTACKAMCMLRMRGRDGEYRLVQNSTQVVGLSPTGKIWLILCCYALASMQMPGAGISPCIVDSITGEIRPLSFEARRQRVLTDREREVLRLIQTGRPSKQIAYILGISVNTVSRHRQNIIEKLSVGNCVEAIAAATAMKLI